MNISPLIIRLFLNYKSNYISVCIKFDLNAFYISTNHEVLIGIGKRV